MIGVIKSALPNGRGLTALAALEEAAGIGAGGLLFNSLFDISASLDMGELQEVRAEAGRRGMVISSMLGVVNPALPARGEAIARAGDGDLAAGVKRLVQTAADIGIRDLFFVIGMIEDRFSMEVSWADQREAVARLVRDCGPLLRDQGARLFVKTHEEITTTEIRSLVERAGPDILGVGFDPVNVPCRLEDPIEAARRVAPFVGHVYLDDAVLRFQENGFRRFLAPLGEGMIDLPALLALFPTAKRWVEMHSGQFAMPALDRDWLSQQPAVEIGEFASLMKAAVDFGGRDVPWDQAAPTARLPHAMEWLSSQPSELKLKLSRQAFIETFGACFRNGADLAGRAYDALSRRGHYTSNDIFPVLCTEFERLSSAERMPILQAYTPLDARIEAAAIVAEPGLSRSLDVMTEGQKAKLLRLLGEYCRKFGYGAIFVVRNYSTASLLSALDERFQNDAGREMMIACGEVERLAEIQIAAAIAKLGNA